LAKKIATSAVGRQSRIIPFLSSSNVRAQVLRNNGSDHLLMEDGYDIFVNVNPILEERIGCKLAQLSVYHLSWGAHTVSHVTPIPLVLKGRIGWRCANASMSRRANLMIVSNYLPQKGAVDDYWNHKGGVPLIMTGAQSIELSLSAIE